MEMGDSTAGTELIDSILSEVSSPYPSTFATVVDAFLELVRKWLFFGHNSVEQKKDLSIIDEVWLPEQGSHDHKSAAIPIASSPPFFAGTPPCRASNPLIQDVQFGNERLMHGGIPPFPAPSSPSCKSGPHMKFGSQPAAIRIEGFDCLGRDRSNCSISALA